jgi:hypothetical protein
MADSGTVLPQDLKPILAYCKSIERELQFVMADSKERGRLGCEQISADILNIQKIVEALSR